MPEELVTIATFNVAVEADLARAKLESEGIECFLADEYSRYLQAGGIKLQVGESDAQRAVEILGESSTAENDSEESASECDAPRCPRCDSIAVDSPGFSFLKRKWKCQSCGYQWKG
jgi:hypothetical protein